ncbi:hypothetical protein C0991_006567, partial [Blastosporella zonata]
MPNAPAIVSQASPGHPPIMSTGCITMENLAEFRNCAKRHFAYKSIPADTQVSQILFCFDDHNVSAWIAANDETLSTLTFENFLLQFGKCLVTPQCDAPFGDWSSGIRHANNAVSLVATLFQSDARLQVWIRILMHEDLQAEYTAKNTSADRSQAGTLDNIVKLDDWCTAVSHIDKGLRAKRERESKSYLRQLKAMGNLSSAQASSTPTANFANTRSHNNAATPQSGSRPPRSYALPLTIEERNLLTANKGCTACRKVFLPPDHKCIYRDKPLPFGLVPTITQAHVDKICSDIIARRDKNHVPDSNHFTSTIASTSNIASILELVLPDIEEESRFKLLDDDVDMHPD